MRKQLDIEKIEQIKQAKKGDKLAFEAIIMDNIDYLYRVAYTTLRNEDNVDEVINYYYIQEKKVSEISKILKVPEGTIKSRLSRARRMMADMLKYNIEEV